MRMAKNSAIATNGTSTLISTEPITSYSFLLNTDKSREFVKDRDTYYEVQ